MGRPDAEENEPGGAEGLELVVCEKGRRSAADASVRKRLRRGEGRQASTLTVVIDQRVVVNGEEPDDGKSPDGAERGEEEERPGGEEEDEVGEEGEEERDSNLYEEGGGGARDERDRETSASSEAKSHGRTDLVLRLVLLKRRQTEGPLSDKVDGQVNEQGCRTGLNQLSVSILPPD
jgi:hypothetical protein